MTWAWLSCACPCVRAGSAMPVGATATTRGPGFAGLCRVRRIQSCRAVATMTKWAVFGRTRPAGGFSNQPEGFAALAADRPRRLAVRAPGARSGPAARPCANCIAQGEIVVCNAAPAHEHEGTSLIATVNWWQSVVKWELRGFEHVSTRVIKERL